MNRDAPFETVEKWRSLVDLVYKLTIAGKMAWAESAKEGESSSLCRSCDSFDQKGLN